MPAAKATFHSAFIILSHVLHRLHARAVMEIHHVARRNAPIKGLFISSIRKAPLPRDTAPWTLFPSRLCTQLCCMDLFINVGLFLALGCVLYWDQPA